MGLSGKVEYKRLRDLHPDPQNPRLPRNLRGTLSDEELFDCLADSFDALALAESIARHGYFASEPMIVTKEDKKWIVLEGNRRLTALRGLAQEELRATFDSTERWDQAVVEVAEKETITLDFQVPVIVAPTRVDADAVIGFRHIGSVLPWKPVQRAQFLAYLIDERGESFAEAADTVGEEEAVVKLLYRNQSIITCAESFGRSDVAAKAIERFGIFTTALNRSALRDYIGAKPVNQVKEKAPQLQKKALPNLVELASWLYGSNGDPRVIRESRQITQLATVVADDKARAELQRTRDLEGALAVSSLDTELDTERAMRSLKRGVSYIESAADSINLIASEELTVELSERLDCLAEEIHEAVRPEKG